ncbi:MAG TPA: aminotransferase class III-fold pyridoxal phosphate-dependent enzyme [Thermoanaerobaculia bacterium]|jgi:acetylornithine/succinyldiaminopimelate/putrescine aminotransferase|nr:aminotransferase class III-fold pyridoxal phosphate-dependent enzyme [Thermoanaerobaculia bacterium]
MIESSVATDVTSAPPALLPVYDQLPFAPVRGQGVWLWDAQGRRVLDLWGGHAVALLGHGHPRLLAALHDQAASLLFQSNALPMAIREVAASRLAAFAPAGLPRVFLVNSGAEANENALLLALRATGRKRVVAVEGAFHGRTAAAAAVSWGKHRHAFARFPFDVTFVPRGDREALVAAIGDDVAAFIVEPVQGVAGAFDLGRDYLAAARAATRRAGALLIFDEIQSGMGRTGWPFAAQMYDVTPDLLTVAKGLAGGFPAGAVLASEEVVDGVGVGDLGSTFGGGPLAAALILAVLDVIAGEDLLARVRDVGARLRERCVVGPVVAAQGAGLLVGLRTAPPARQVVDALLARGILTGTSADPHVLRLLPPLVTGAEHVDLLAGALAEVGAELPASPTQVAP